MAAWLLPGCSYYQGTLPVATTRPANLDLRGVNVPNLPIKRRIPGRDSGVTSFLGIPLPWAPRLDEAVESAIEHGGGDVAVRVHVETTRFWFLVSWARINVVGDIVELGELASHPTVPDEQIDLSWGLGPEHEPGDGRRQFTAISTELAPLFGYQFEDAHRVPDVEAEDRVIHILWMPTRPEPPSLAGAISKALFRGDGNVVTDASVDYRWWGIPFLFGVEGWRVEGDVVRATGP